MILTYLIKEITCVSLTHCVRIEALMVMNLKITVFWKISSHTLWCYIPEDSNLNLHMVLQLWNNLETSHEKFLVSSD